jgi:hypothetical protein
MCRPASSEPTRESCARSFDAALHDFRALRALYEARVLCPLGFRAPELRIFGVFLACVQWERAAVMVAVNPAETGETASEKADSRATVTAETRITTVDRATGTWMATCSTASPISLSPSIEVLVV